MIREDEQKIHREQGKKWTLRKVYQFGMAYDESNNFRPNNCEYDVLGFRAPKKGEWYLSGARPSMYQAPNDLSMVFLVCKPTIRRKLRTVSMYY